MRELRRDRPGGEAPERSDLSGLSGPGLGNGPDYLEIPVDRLVKGVPRSGRSFVLAWMDLPDRPLVRRYALSFEGGLASFDVEMARYDLDLWTNQVRFQAEVARWAKPAGMRLYRDWYFGEQGWW